jgi:hypothetical protein
MSKIYKIESLLSDDVYYGTTTKKYLSERMTYYKFEYKKYLLAKLDDNNFKKYCSTKQEYGHDSLLNYLNYLINLILETLKLISLQLLNLKIRIVQNHIY